MKTFACRITYRDSPKESAGYLATFPDGREVAVGASLAKPPSAARPTPPPHVMADMSGFLLTVPPDGRLVYEPDGDGWLVHIVEPDLRPAVTKCIAARRVPNFAGYPYWGVGIFEARPRQEDGVWTWRAVDWAEPWTYPASGGQFQPRGYRSIKAVPKWEWSQRLGLPIIAVKHGQRVT